MQGHQLHVEKISGARRVFRRTRCAARRQPPGKGTSPDTDGAPQLDSWRADICAAYMGIIQSPVSTCKLLDVDPYTYLVDV